MVSVSVIDISFCAFSIKYGAGCCGFFVVDENICL